MYSLHTAQSSFVSGFGLFFFKSIFFKTTVGNKENNPVVAQKTCGYWI